MIKLITGNYDCYCACETCLNSAKCPKRPQAQIVICATKKKIVLDHAHFEWIKTVNQIY